MNYPKKINIRTEGGSYPILIGNNILKNFNKNYLQLIDGFIHEKNKDNKVQIIKFEKTLYDFTKYKSDLTTYPKLQERSLLWLFNELKNNRKEKNNTIFEIHKRIFKPSVSYTHLRAHET